MTKAVVLGRGSNLLQHERAVVERVARDLPEGYRLWSGLTLFDPLGDIHEIDAVALGHHGVYVLELKHFEGTITADAAIQSALAHAVKIGRLLKSALAQQLAGEPPWVEPLVVLTHDEVDIDLPDELRRQVVTPPELLRALLLGKLPGGEADPERVPLDEALAREISQVLNSLRRRVQPGRGNLVQELQLLQRDLVADLREAAPNHEPRAHSTIEEMAALWVIVAVFVRVLEERRLVDTQRLAGEAERVYFEHHPEHTARDYLRFVMDEIAALPACAPIVSALRGAAGSLSPSRQGAEMIFDFLRRSDGPGNRRWNFVSWGERLWGDLYQSLSEPLSKASAMLQTPDFVEAFLLDFTLEPAVVELGLDGVRVIDPACGSGSMLVSAFKRLCEYRLGSSPASDPRASAREALDLVYGVDISALATTITHIRLLFAYLDRTGITRMAEVAALPVHVDTTDALLPPSPGSVLARRYEVVVCNPPYITARDPERRDQYRQRYRSAAGKFSLVPPFVERSFQLAEEGGFVGLFVSNSFMNRAFGKPLVEEVLSKVEITHVVDSSGAFIPGYGTPTAFLFGRNRSPRAPTIRVVAGKRGEPIMPIEPKKGKVWSAIVPGEHAWSRSERRIVGHVNQPGYEDDYIAVTDIPRAQMVRHPWSLGGGFAQRELIDRLRSLSEILSTVAGFRAGSASGADDVFILPQDVPARLGIEPEATRALLRGGSIHDFGASLRWTAIAPYQDDGAPMAQAGNACWYQFLWRYRAFLWAKPPSGARPPAPWWAWQWWVNVPGRLRIAFPAIARSNQFVLVRERALASRTVSVVVLPGEAPEEDVFLLLGYLNSSMACFWIKQTAPSMTSPDASPERTFYHFVPGSLGALPVPSVLLRPGPLRDKVVTLARQLDRAAHALEDQYAPERVLARWDRVSRDSLVEALGDAQMRAQTLRRRMVCYQEDLDWVVYEALGLTEEPTQPVSATASPEQRPFAWLTDEPSQGLDRRLVDPWRRRREAMQRSPALRILERPLYKRPFDDVVDTEPPVEGEDESEERISLPARAQGYRDRTAAACERWLLDRLEDIFHVQPPRCLSAEELAARLDTSPGARPVIETWNQRSRREWTVDQGTRELLFEHAVPYLAALRHTETGLEKRAAWELAWALQRREDAGEQVSPEAVPPRYDRKDYRDAVSFRHRGKLDVPTERFIVYPDARQDEQDTLYGWAGWTPTERVEALMALVEQRRREDGWESTRLVPLLAGVLELVFWMPSWHGTELQPGSEAVRALQWLEMETQALAVKMEALRKWRPFQGNPKTRRGRRRS